MIKRYPPVVVIGGAVLLMLLGVLLGFRMLTSPFGEADAAGPTCSPTTVGKGDDVTPNLVTVDVYNASERAGLANRVSINLQRRGFLAGKVGNSESKVRPRGVAILAKDAKDPRVRLVKSQFGSARVVEPDIAVGDNVAVVIGTDVNQDLRRKGSAREVKADRSLTVCTPTVEVEDVK